ncbi:ArsR/SmtB family transcription factor [Microbacterium sp. NPDC055665]
MSDLNESGGRGPISMGVMLLGASPARVELLRLVLDHHELTALEIMDVLGMTRNGVGKHLDELTAAGFLIARRATHPRGVGGVIYWRANRERIAAELWAFTGALLGYEGQSNRVG